MASLYDTLTTVGWGQGNLVQEWPDQPLDPCIIGAACLAVGVPLDTLRREGTVGVWGLLPTVLRRALVDAVCVRWDSDVDPDAVTIDDDAVLDEDDVVAFWNDQDHRTLEEVLIVAKDVDARVADWHEMNVPLPL